MAYQVLARKWRPRNFPEMVGQAHVLRALSNALENDRLHHAYLFTGTRGVGKTTIARIFAKSLNCENGDGVTAYPCGECAACREIDQGRFVDLIEVDAASRTKVEDTRDLLDNVQYAPTRGRYKVYLIDEVHMLSSHSFNALLKTLEEPPPHVKFLLATTDPQKLPPTILSRCLQFNLKRLPLEQIIDHLIKIVESEEISYEIPALRLLALGADGSLRDALSLLDQAIAYGAGKVSKDDVSSMLGSLDQNSVLNLVQVLAANDAPGVLQQVAHLAEQNPDFFALLGDILSLLQQIALAQVVPSSIDINEAEGEAILQLAEHVSHEDVQLFYQIALVGRRDLPLAPEPRGGFEMVMLRMLAFRPNTVSYSPAPPVASAPNVVKEAPPPMSTTSVPASVSTVSTVSTNSDVSTVSTNSDEWGTIASSLGLIALVKQLAIRCSLKQREGDVWHLTLHPDHGFLLKEARKKQIELALQKQFGASQKLRIRVEHSDAKAETVVVKQPALEDEPQKSAENQIENEPFVVYMKENCDAKVIG